MTEPPLSWFPTPYIPPGQLGWQAALPTSSALSAPVMQAVAAMLAPTLGIGPNVSAPVMAAAAALLAPSVSCSANVIAPVMAATAVMPVPSAFIGVAVAVPTMAATAALLAPTVSTAAAVAVPLLRATAAMPAPTLSVGATVLAPLLQATAAMPAPTVAVSKPPVTIKGATTNAGTSITTMPTHAVGDIILIFALGGGTTVATKPGAAGNVPAWVDIDNAAPSAGLSHRTCYAVATQTGHTSGTWVNANSMTAVVLSGQNGSTPIGGHATQGYATPPGGAGQYQAPSVTMTATDGTSALIHTLGQIFNVSDVWGSATGYTTQSHVAHMICVSKNSTTSDGTVTVGFASQNQAGGGATVEVLA